MSPVKTFYDAVRQSVENITEIVNRQTFPDGERDLPFGQERKALQAAIVANIGALYAAAIRAEANPVIQERITAVRDTYLVMASAAHQLDPRDVFPEWNDSLDTVRQALTELHPFADDPPEPIDSESIAHSQDFASVKWLGTLYTFTPIQAACVKVLYETWENGTPVIGEQAILESVESTSPLRKLFQDHPAWNTMIVSPAKGRFRLSE